MEKVQNLVAKSKLQTLNIVLFFFSFVFTFFTFFGVKGFLSASLWQVGTTTDLIVFLLTVAAVAANAFIMFKVYNNVSVAPKFSMLVTLVSAIVAGFNFIWVLLFVLTNSIDGVSLGTGFYFFQLTNLAIAGVNGYKIYQNKSLAKTVMKETKAGIVEKSKDLQTSATTATTTAPTPAATVEEKKPEAPVQSV